MEEEARLFYMGQAPALEICGLGSGFNSMDHFYWDHDVERKASLVRSWAAVRTWVRCIWLLNIMRESAPPHTLIELIDHTKEGGGVGGLLLIAEGEMLNAPVK